MGQTLSRMYRAWFGEDGSKGFADPQSASVMHANALRMYFRHALAALQQQMTGTNQQFLARAIAELEPMSLEASLGDFENWIRERAEDWNIPIENESSQQDPSAPRTLTAAVPPRKKRSLILRLSLYLNLMLLGTLILLLLLWPSGTEAVTSPRMMDKKELDATTVPSTSTLFFSSYCVVFPTQGTISEKVGAALQDLFPDQFQEMKRNAPDHDKLLQQK